MPVDCWEAAKNNNEMHVKLNVLVKKIDVFERYDAGPFIINLDKSDISLQQTESFTKSKMSFCHQGMSWPKNKKQKRGGEKQEKKKEPFSFNHRLLL